MSDTPTVLFVDDEKDLRIAAEQSLMLADLPIQTFANAEEALKHVSRGFAGILVTDIRMDGMNGTDLMQAALEIDSEFPVILVTGHGDVDLAVQSMRDGAYDFLEKPYAPARLVGTIRRALDKRRLTVENRALKREVGQRDKVEARMIGRSDIMVGTRKSIRAIADTDADVLLTGETGTGKDLTARIIHDTSSRSAHPFVHINCAALPDHLVESELFGHEAGAFPGAMRPRYGKFEHARQGTVFLDEIDSLTPNIQAKLLSAIQDRQITRLGSNDPVTLDIRIVAACKSDLTTAVAEGSFRADLLYRLNVVTLHLPTLAERRDDIPGLFLTLVAQSAARISKPTPEVPAEVLTQLTTQDWPGNVRELRNAADRYVLGLPLTSEAAQPEDSQTMAEQMAAYEKSLIMATLTAQNGSLKHTYAALGLSRKSLYEKMQKHGLSKP